MFIDHPGGSLIQDRATDVRIQELRIPAHTNVTALRASISMLGDGFVEAIGNSTLQAIANAQPSSQRGQLISVPVLEAPGRRPDRTLRLEEPAGQPRLVLRRRLRERDGDHQPAAARSRPTSNGTSVDELRHALPATRRSDDEGVDVELFALFMRSTQAPPRDPVRAATADARDGSNIFNQIGCATCHTRTIVTAAPGTLINGGALKVANALGNKIIHPFGDFLLHDIGTGDGIVQNGGPSTRNKVRTVPLWGLRARGRFMHDAFSFNLNDAIHRHGESGRSVARTRSTRSARPTGIACSRF